MARNESEQRIVASANGEGFRPYDRYGTPIKGLSWLPLRLSRPTLSALILATLRRARRRLKLRRPLQARQI